MVNDARFVFCPTKLFKTTILQWWKMGHLEDFGTASIFLLSFVLFLQNWHYLLLLGTAYAAFYLLKKNEKLDIGGKAVFITGCDSGFGLHLAKRLHDRGFSVFAGVYSEDSPGACSLKSRKHSRLHVIQVDVTKIEDVKAAFKVVEAKCNGLWAVVNNAGIHFPGDIELVTVDQYQRCTDVNFYGMLRVIKTFLPLIRKTKGRIVNMSSVKGRYSWPGDSIYSVTKHSIETMSDSLRLEMTKFGVKVSVIEPGQYGAATSLFGAAQIDRLKAEVDHMWAEASDDVRATYGREYFDRIIHRISVMIKNRKVTPTDPVLDAIEDAILSTSPKKRYLVGGSFVLIDKLTMLAKFYSFMPEWMSDSLVFYMSGYKTKLS